EVVCVGRRDLAFMVDGHQAGRREQYLARTHLADLPEEERLLDGRRRILHQIEDRVALRTVVENAGPAAHNQSLSAEDVISEAEGGGDVDAGSAVQSLLYPLPRLKHSVSQLARVRHDPSNVGRRDDLPCYGVFSYTRSTRVRVGSVESRRVRRPVLVGQEIGRLRGLVKLLLNPVKTHAVVERHAVGQLPVILRVPLDVVVAVLAGEVARRLRESVINADGSVGEAEARVAGVRDVVDEIVDAVV